MTQIDTHAKMREALPARPREQIDVALSMPIRSTSHDDKGDEKNRNGDDETLARLSRRVDDLERQIANALESFSTRLSNAKHAVNSDVAKTHALAKRAVDMIETLAVTLDEKANENDSRMSAVENRLRSLECALRQRESSTAPATPGEFGKHEHHHHTVLQVKPSPSGGSTKGEGRVESSNFQAAVTLVRVFGSTAVRITVSIVVLWTFFWLTIIALVLLDDWRLVSNFSDAVLRSRNWRDDILGLMN